MRRKLFPSASSTRLAVALLVALLALVSSSVAQDDSARAAPDRLRRDWNKTATEAQETVPLPNPSEPAVRSRVYVLPGGIPSRRLRGDWEPSDAVVLAFAEQWSQSLASLMAIAVDQAEIYLLADPERTSEDAVYGWLARSGFGADDIHVVWTRLNSSWVRDYGPIETHTETGDPVWLDAQYEVARPADDQVPRVLAAMAGVRSEALPFRLDGGALVSNGSGLCVATTEYFAENALDVDDPPLLDALLRQLGCRALVLVPALHDDPTRHADMLAQFLAADLVAIARVDIGDSAEDAARMDEAARGVQAAATQLGLAMRVVRIPVPYYGKGRYRTYLNGVRFGLDLVVPAYDDVPDPVEFEVYDLLAAALPNKDIVMVPADAIIPLGGSLHCISLGLTLPKNACRHSPSGPYAPRAHETGASPLAGIASTPP